MYNYFIEILAQFSKYFHCIVYAEVLVMCGINISQWNRYDNLNIGTAWYRKIILAYIVKIWFSVNY
jgi:hypothetical protein